MFFIKTLYVIYSLISHSKKYNIVLTKRTLLMTLMVAARSVSLSTLRNYFGMCGNNYHKRTTLLIKSNQYSRRQIRDLRHEASLWDLRHREGKYTDRRHQEAANEKLKTQTWRFKNCVWVLRQVRIKLP